MNAQFRRRARNRAILAAVKQAGIERLAAEHPALVHQCREHVSARERLGERLRQADANMAMVWQAIPPNNTLRAPANHPEDITTYGVDPYARAMQFLPARRAELDFSPGAMAADAVITYQLLELLDAVADEDWDKMGWNVRVRMGAGNPMVYGVMVSRAQLRAMDARRRQQLLRLYMQEAADRLADDLGKRR